LTLSLLLLTATSCKFESAAPALEVTFLFNDKAGLEEGDIVMVRGFEVGRVHRVGLAGEVEVQVRIDAKHRQAIRSACYGRIQSDPSGSHLEIVVVDSESPVLSNGTRVPGATTKFQALKEEARLRGKKVYQSGKKVIEELLE
jgi:ABC-type transporter Mla subunit MlaD